MSQSDSRSAYDDETIIRPSPGGRRRQPPVEPPLDFSGSGSSGNDLRTDGSNGSNPLTSSAADLLSLVTKLRNLPFHRDINELQERLESEIKDFENRAVQKGAIQSHVDIAKYFLCSLIDETITHTPWGSQSNWGHQGLTVLFFRDPRGGEKFFKILSELKQQPMQNINLLELAYLCLSLGFEGKYRYSQNRLSTLEQERREIYLLMQNSKGTAERDLSIHWQGVRNLQNPLVGHIPLWVIAVVAGALLTIIYLGYAYAINRASDRACNQWVAIAEEEAKSPVIPELPKITPAPILNMIDRFRKLLASEIAQNMVEVTEGPILRITNAFPSGSDKIKKDFRPMLAKISQELQDDSTPIVVVGHTDNKKIKFSARFQSNWHLSIARAKNVAGILKSHASLGERVRSDGRADWEPIAPNDTKENRALNRRIDIHIR